MPKIKTNCVICGKEIYRWPYQLRDYHPCCSRTCWAKNNLGRKPPNKANLLNQKYGMLTVLEDVGSRSNLLRRFFMLVKKTGKFYLQVSDSIKKSAIHLHEPNQIRKDST